MATSNVVVKFDEDSLAAMRKLSEEINLFVQKVDNIESSENLYHDDQTLNKIYPVLYNYGLNTAQVTEAIGQLQNEGILFRERKRND